MSYLIANMIEKIKKEMQDKALNIRITIKDWWFLRPMQFPTAGQWHSAPYIEQLQSTHFGI